MKLLETEANVLACAELRANTSIDEIRKLTGYKAHTVRYALNKMIGNGLIRYMPFINMGALGLTEYNLFFSLSFPQSVGRGKFIEHLRRTKRVTWLAELGGEYQYALSIIAKTTSQLQDVISTLSGQFGDIFLDKVASAQFSYSLLPRRFLSSKDFKVEPLVNRPLEEGVKIDELDHRIIGGLVSHNFVSHRQIALKLGVPLSTMELRIRELEKRGVIQGYIFDLDISRLNIQHFKVMVFARGVSSKLKDGIRQFALQNRKVVYLVECFGNWDFEIGVEVFDPKEVTRLVESLQDRFGSSIHSIKVLHKFRDLKSVTYPIELATSQ